MPPRFIRITRNTLYYSGSVHFSGCKIKAVWTIANSQDWYSLPTLKCSRETLTTSERVGGPINGDCGCCLMSAVFPLASAFSLAAVWGKQEHAFPRLPQHALNSKLNLHDCITILEEFAFKVVSCQIRKIFYLRHSFTTLKLGSISWKNENRGLNKAENKNRIDFPKLSPISLLKFKSEIRQLINENNSFNVFNAIRFWKLRSLSGFTNFFLSLFLISSYHPIIIFNDQISRNIKEKWIRRWDTNSEYSTIVVGDGLLPHFRTIQLVETSQFPSQDIPCPGSQQILAWSVEFSAREEASCGGNLHAGYRACLEACFQKRKVLTYFLFENANSVGLLSTGGRHELASYDHWLK